MITLLNLIAILAAVGMGYIVALDTREPMDRLSGSLRFGVFLVVAGGAGLLFRDAISLLAPFLQGFVSLDSLLNLIVGLIIIGATVWVYLLTKPDITVLMTGMSTLANKASTSTWMAGAAIPRSTAVVNCPRCSRSVSAAATYCEFCGAAVQPAAQTP